MAKKNLSLPSLLGPAMQQVMALVALVILYAFFAVFSNRSFRANQRDGARRCARVGRGSR